MEPTSTKTRAYKAIHAFISNKGGRPVLTHKGNTSGNIKAGCDGRNVYNNIQGRIEPAKPAFTVEVGGKCKGKMNANHSLRTALTACGDPMAEDVAETVHQAGQEAKDIGGEGIQ